MNGSQKGEIQIRSSDLKGFEGTKKKITYVKFTKIKF